MKGNWNQILLKLFCQRVEIKLRELTLKQTRGFFFFFATLTSCLLHEESKTKNNRQCELRVDILVITFCSSRDSLMRANFLSSDKFHFPVSTWHGQSKQNWKHHQLATVLWRLKKRQNYTELRHWWVQKADFLSVCFVTSFAPADF